jgi:hypothetical protein
LKGDEEMRITKTMCQKQVDFLNRTIFGDEETYRKDEEGRWRSIPERYVIDHSYGGYRLCRYCNEGGGQMDITNYRMTARELYYVITGINTVLRLDAHKPLLNSMAYAEGVSHVQH